MSPGAQPSWCLPGGHLEAGETPLAAGVRETAEETGIEPTAAHVLAVCVDTTGSGITFALEAQADPDSALRVTEPHAIDRWHWTDPRHLPEPLFPATEAVLHVWRTPRSPLPGWDLHLIQPSRTPTPPR